MFAKLNHTAIDHDHQLHSIREVSTSTCNRSESCFAWEARTVARYCVLFFHKHYIYRSFIEQTQAKWIDVNVQHH